MNKAAALPKAARQGSSALLQDAQKELEVTKQKLKQACHEREAGLTTIARLQAEVRSLKGPASNDAAAMFHINKAVEALKAIADTSVDNTVIPVDSQHANMLGKAQQLEQAAKKAVFGSQEWAMAVQELTKLVASVHVTSQLSAAEAELSAHRNSSHRQVCLRHRGNCSCCLYSGG